MPIWKAVRSNLHKMRVKKKISVYPGTFDPITMGHIDVIRRSLRLFDNIIVVVANNRRKNTLFSVDERVSFIKSIYKNNTDIKVTSYEGLIVDFMDKVKATAIIRGLRAVSDFEFELQMALTNRSLNSEVETVFLMPDAKYIYLNSSMVKEVAQFGGKLSHFVPPVVVRALRERFKK